MSRFKDYIYKHFGYEIPAIDLAIRLGDNRGERVSKWFRGDSYPGGHSVKLLAEVLMTTEQELKKTIFEMKALDAIDG